MRAAFRQRDMRNAMTLKDKVAIVTGGNTGIGKAIAVGLAKAGASIVIDYIADPAATEALEREIASFGDQAIGLEADVSRIEDLQRHRQLKGAVDRERHFGGRRS
jgi:NAD(P)-dependent dehydrogenase (short-subunit alcohol dehydrogenase family)